MCDTRTNSTACRVGTPADQRTSQAPADFACRQARSNRCLLICGFSPNCRARHLLLVDDSSGSGLEQDVAALTAKSLSGLFTAGRRRAAGAGEAGEAPTDDGGDCMTLQAKETAGSTRAGRRRRACAFTAIFAVVFAAVFARATKPLSGSGVCSRAMRRLHLQTVCRKWYSCSV